MNNRQLNSNPLPSLGLRKPLGDCTNTLSRSSSSDKFTNPSLSSSLKRITNQTSLKEKPNHVNNNNYNPIIKPVTPDLDFARIQDQTTVKDKSSNSEAASMSPVTITRRVTRRMSANFSFPASAPPLTNSQNSVSHEGVSGKEFDEPYSSVYTVRRKTRKNYASSSSSAIAPLRLDLISSSSRKKTRQANESNSKPFKTAPKKKQKMEKLNKDNLIHGADKDFMEQQKAYFAEVDAFELEEEEVSCSDLD